MLAGPGADAASFSRRTPRRSPGRTPRLLVTLVVGAVLTAAFAWMGAAWAQEDSAAPDEANDPTNGVVARLTVVPYGEQRFDLLSGETTLPDGGTIVDTETGLRLEASFIRYLEGEYIEAQDARADTANGRLTAPTLSIDVPNLLAVAPAGVTFEREGLEVVAEGAELRFGPQLARFERPSGEQLGLEAVALLLDLVSGDALLLGPYRFQDGPFTLSDDREGSVLQLRPVVAEDGSASYRAANEVDEDLWARVEPLR